MTIINAINSNPNHTIFIDSNNLRDETQAAHYHKWNAMETSMGYNNEAFTGADVCSLTSPRKSDSSDKYFRTDETHVQYIGENNHGVIENGLIHSVESARSSLFPPIPVKSSRSEVTSIDISANRKKRNTDISDQSPTSNNINRTHEAQIIEIFTEERTQTEVCHSSLAPSGNLSIPRSGSLAYSEAVYASISSALRGLFAGCFRCHWPEGGAACLDQTESDQQRGAWFDCGQMQKNQNFSYLNPAIVRSEDDLAPSGLKIPVHQAASKAASSSVEQVEIHSFPTSMMFPETEERPNKPTQCDETKQSVFLPASENLNHRDDSLFKIGTTGHVSFATKLEEDHRHREVDIERSEGSSLHPSSYQTFGVDRTAQWSKPLTVDEGGRQPEESHESALSVPGKDPLPKNEIGPSEDIFFGVESFGFGSDDIYGDVWEDTELEEAFGIYNLNAFYSYGSTSPIVLTSSPSRPVNEKFEEIFPASKPQGLRPNTPLEITDSEQNCMVPAVNAHKENYLYEEDQRKWISKDALNNIIQQFLLLDQDATFSELFRTYKDNLSCDNYFIFKGRRITKLLLFDLVNEQRLHCNVHFLSSSLFTGPYSHERVEASVMKVLDTEGERHRKKIERKVIFDEQKYENDLLVDSLVVDSLKREESSWTNFEKEELERKKSICDEIMNDLLLETAIVFKNILKNR